MSQAQFSPNPGYPNYMAPPTGGPSYGPPAPPQYNPSYSDISGYPEYPGGEKHDHTVIYVIGGLFVIVIIGFIIWAIYHWSKKRKCTDSTKCDRGEYCVIPANATDGEGTCDPIKPCSSAGVCDTGFTCSANNFCFPNATS